MVWFGLLFAAVAAAVCVPVSNRAARGLYQPAAAAAGAGRPTFSVAPRPPARPIAPAASEPDEVFSQLAGTLMGVSEIAGGSVSLELLVSSGTGQFARCKAPSLMSLLVDGEVLFDARTRGVADLGEVVVKLRTVAVAGEVFREREVHIEPAELAS